MQQSNGRVADFQQVWGDWTRLLIRIYDDPKVSQLMNSRIGQYLSSHPVVALSVLVFGAISVLPVGLFLTFAIVTIVISLVAFLFVEAFLLFVGGLTLLGVLTGIAFFSVVASLIFNVFYIAMSNILKGYYPHLTKKSPVQGSESEPSKPKEKL
ncbi:uncharacterized protein V6R79_022795 [Siganus canaliculatus]